MSPLMRTREAIELARQVVDSHPELRAHVVLISTRCEEDFAELITASPAA